MKSGIVVLSVLCRYTTFIDVVVHTVTESRYAAAVLHGVSPPPPPF